MLMELNLKGTKTTMASTATKYGCLSFIIVVVVCLSQASSLDMHADDVYLQFGDSEEIECLLMTDENLSIGDVDAAYWYREAVATKCLVMSNFQGTIYHGRYFISGKYVLTERFSLVINNVTASDEGQYFCQLKTARPGFRTAPVNVTVFVPPSRQSPEVTQCHLTDSQDGCLIELQPEEDTYHLTCHMINARPAVRLQWQRALNDGSREAVSNVTYEVNGMVQNVSQVQGNYLFATFATVTEMYRGETTLVCQAFGVALAAKNGTSLKVHITRLNPPTSSYSTQLHVSTTPSNTESVPGVLIALCIIIAVSVLIAVVLLGLILVCKKPWRRYLPYNTVTMADLHSTNRAKGAENLRIFADQLKTYYNKRLNTISTHPVFARCVGKIKDVFIDLQLLRETNKTLKSDRMVRMKGRQGFYPDNPVKVPLASQDDLIRLLDAEGHVALVGIAGSGKTTCARKMACDWADQVTGAVLSRFKLVVVLGMRDIRVSQSSGLLDAIQRVLPKETQLSRADIADLISEHQKDTLIVLDGLDEVSSQVLDSAPPNRDDLSVKDVLLLQALRDCHVLVTTRLHKLNELDNSYAIVETIGFSPANRDKYIGQFFCDDVEKGAALIREVQSTAFIHTLAQSPIMLLLLCVIWNRDDSLPQRLTNLYERAVEILVSHFLEKDTHATHEEVDAVKDEIGRVAFEGLTDPDGERLVFEPAEFPNFLAGGLTIGVLYQESKAVCTELVEMVNFLHKSFQEFFAARFLATQATEKIQSELLPQVTIDSIQEKEYLLRFCCGMNVDAAASILRHVKGLHEELQTQEYLWIQNFTLVLAFEANSATLLADIGSRLTLKYKEDFPAMEYYLKRCPEPVRLQRLNIHLTLITDQCLARNILAGVTVESLYFHIELSDQLKRQLSDLERTISQIPRQADVMRLYVTADREQDGKPADEMVLKNQVNHLCDFVREQPVLASGFGVGLDGKILQSCQDFSALVDALAASSAAYLCVENSSLHGYLHVLSPLFESLTSLVLRGCCLADNDLGEVSTSLASSPGRLTCLYLQEGACTEQAVDTLVQSVRNHKTMVLEKLYLVKLGVDTTAITNIVQRYLPGMRESKQGFFVN